MKSVPAMRTTPVSCTPVRINRKYVETTEKDPWLQDAPRAQDGRPVRTRSRAPRRTDGRSAGSAACGSEPSCCHRSFSWFPVFPVDPRRRARHGRRSHRRNALHRRHPHEATRVRDPHDRGKYGVILAPATQRSRARCKNRLSSFTGHPVPDRDLPCSPHHRPHSPFCRGKPSQKLRKK